MSATSVENCIGYTNPANQELDMVFSFHHLKVDYVNKEKWTSMPFDFNEFKDLLHTWQVKMQEGNGWNAVFLNCHDQPRSVSRFGNEMCIRDRLKLYLVKKLKAFKMKKKTLLCTI